MSCCCTDITERMAAVFENHMLFGYYLGKIDLTAIETTEMVLK